MEDWKQVAMTKLKKLEQDRAHIRDLDARLAFQNLVSDADREIFQQAIDSINREIEAIKYELILDEMLQSDLSLDEFLEKFGK